MPGAPCCSIETNCWQQADAAGIAIQAVPYVAEGPSGAKRASEGQFGSGTRDCIRGNKEAMSVVAANNNRIRVAVVGAGEFGRNHARVYRELPGAELGRNLRQESRAREANCRRISDESVCVAGRSARPSRCRKRCGSDHRSRYVGCRLMELGLDVLVEKPMASDLAEADALIAAAKKYSRILQVGHVERFNPAVIAVEPILNRPLFFEVHRLGVFTPRSLDVDVIFDLMIHDLDILLTLVKEPVTEVKAVGIPVLTDKVDIAHARLGICRRRGRQRHREPGVDRACPQDAFLSATRIHLARLCPARRIARRRQKARAAAGICIRKAQRTRGRAAACRA